MSKQTKKTQLFEYEALQNKQHVVQYLKALIEGIEKGELYLSDEEEHLVLRPSKMMQLNIRGKQGKNKQELRLKLAWNGEAVKKKLPSDLTIQPHKRKESHKSHKRTHKD